MDVDELFPSSDARRAFERRNPPAPYWLRLIEHGRYVTLDPDVGDDTIPVEQAFRLHASGLAEVVSQDGLAFIRLTERGLHQLRELERFGAFAAGGAMLRAVPQG